MWLWGSLTDAGAPLGALHARGAVVALADLAHGSILGHPLEDLRGRAVLLAIGDQLSTALALIELDGVARRVILCPPDVSAAQLPAVARAAQADACVRDAADLEVGALGLERCVCTAPVLTPYAAARCYSHATEWILLTSATTGAPKAVLHTLASLCAALPQRRPAGGTVVWSTFYDIRRYGGLQILLRALYGGSLVLASAGESVIEFLARAAAAGVTHISGTPSHWRAALMSGATARLAPCYVRLSGEIADQGILDALHAAYPQATVAHAFASTEAGVAFEVDDGLAGFPVALLDRAGAGVELQVMAETLRIRSPGNARCYLGEGVAPIRGSDGFVDTGDRVELRAGRYYFAGRSGGIINVGGLKVHPEEVEAVINAHPWVRMSRVIARRSPITGAVVAAEIVLADASAEHAPQPSAEALTREIMALCRGALATHKVPATIRIVPALAVSASGKLVRPRA